MDGLSEWRGKRVLVTGGTGFVGRRVLHHGLQNGVELHNLSIKRESPVGVTGHRIDLRDREAVTQIVQAVQPDAILHLAAGGVAYGSSDLHSLLQINALGLECLLAAASRLHKPTPIVIAGSWFEYSPQPRPLNEDDPTEPHLAYSVSKVAAQAIAAYYARALPITVLRLFSLYGIGERLPRLVPYIIQAARKGDPIELTPGEQVRDYVYADDAAEAFWRALAVPAAGNKLRVLNVGTGEPLTLKTLIQMLVAVLHEHGIDPHVQFGAKSYRAHETMYALADVTRLRAEFGWVPSTPLRDGLTHTVEAMIGKEAGR